MSYTVWCRRSPMAMPRPARFYGGDCIKQARRQVRYRTAWMAKALSKHFRLQVWTYGRDSFHIVRKGFLYEVWATDENGKVIDL